MLSPAIQLIMARIFSLLLCLATVGLRAQQSDPGQTVLTVRSTLVQVPALVKTKGGQVCLNSRLMTSRRRDDGEIRISGLRDGRITAKLASAFIAGELGIAADIPQHAQLYRQLARALEEGQAGGFQGRNRRPEDRRYGACISSGLRGPSRIVPRSPRQNNRQKRGQRHDGQSSDFSIISSRNPSGSSALR